MIYYLIHDELFQDIDWIDKILQPTMNNYGIFLDILCVVNQMVR